MDWAEERWKKVMPIKRLLQETRGEIMKVWPLAVSPRRISKGLRLFWEWMGGWGWQFSGALQSAISYCFTNLLSSLALVWVVSTPLGHPSLFPRLEICWVLDVQLALPCPSGTLCQALTDLNSPFALACSLRATLSASPYLSSLSLSFKKFYFPF